ncbi:hypothetical protein A2160_03320 [Candidatus Beckwithbacteria bacterium RBG_13_42_9]|uniref:Uncharacterized protein n=1 Tax=Candidatus Beckwithbacteria bacterium RBG_13_42_9 TaxID=1797457 RepID=A0A1F5E987_9BACT|nr:MAG: hypothetical protein A2160_03320 [Candidatus Beckwithbacteria bacterium RBG_13_42_9]
MLKNWPILYKDILLKGDLNSSTAVCTLWTERKAVEKAIGDSKLYSVIGNLYSAQGINAVIRNCLANPKIRTIILWGAELSLSGHALLHLMKYGIDEKRQIINARGEIEKELPARALELFRRELKIIDLRGRPAEELRKTLKQLPQEKPSFKSQIFPKSQPIVKPLPAEATGFRVEGKTAAQTWLKILNEVYKYGRYKHTRYAQTNELKEILNLVAVVGEENPEVPYFPQYLPFSKDELVAYYPEFLSARQLLGTAYNYGHRLRKRFGLDQIAAMKKLIKLRPDSKKMIAVTIDPKLDWARANKGDIPCLTQILGSIQDNRFILTAHFRSQDMVHGWPRNALALRKLQAQIIEGTKYKLGPLVIITHSAHIYSDDFKLVENLLMDHYEKELGFSPAVHFEFDPRGNMVVEVVKKRGRPSRGEKPPYGYIKVTLYEPNGGPPVKEWRGKKAGELVWRIGDGNYIVLPSHTLYIGTELQRAEEALWHNLNYHQDPAPNTLGL